MNRAEARIDLDAIRHNLGVVQDAVTGVPVLAVVKADAYGHGMAEVARAARQGGAAWLGVALPSEALALRACGDLGPVLAWLWTPGDPAVLGCVETGVDLTVSSAWALTEVVAAARTSGVRARVQVKVDTGLSRNGADQEHLGRLLDAVRSAERAGLVEVTGMWSHLARADELDDPTVLRQLQVLEEAVTLARDCGVEPGLLHLANSPAAFAYPQCRLDLVRVGIAMYGVAPMEPGSAARLDLRPAMTLRASVALAKQLPAGAAVSYGGTWTAHEPTYVALIPVGYADGIPRAASNRGSVRIGDVRCPVLGTIAMDQFVVAAPASVREGDEVVVFGADPTADDWAVAAGTIGYEIVTRIGPRVPRTYVGRR